MAYSAEYHRAYYQQNRERILERNRKWAARNQDKVKAAAKRTAEKRRAAGKTRDLARAWEERNREKVLLRAAKGRAARDGVQFDLTLEDIVIPERCPLLGVALSRAAGRGRMKGDSASLDRIDPAKGYVRGNVWVISWAANRLKGDASRETLLSFASGIIRVFAV